MPRRVYERKLRGGGAEFIVGLDEVGRGAWAGPLVAAAVVIPLGVRLSGVRDSKLLSEQQREAAAHTIRQHAAAWAYGVVHHEEIDRVGLTEANQLAFERAMLGLSEPAGHALVDGAYRFALPCACSFIIDGDRTEFLIAAASILAKVFRDRLMRSAHTRYPAYRFDLHKGYGTLKHRAMIRQHGLSRLHRRSFIARGRQLHPMRGGEVSAP